METTTLRGVPAALCAAFDLNPADYTLLGVMADAADEAGESEVGECLRFLWKRQWVPVRFVGGYGWFDKNYGSWPLKAYIKNAPALGDQDSPSGAVWRFAQACPQHKHLLIDALEKETVT